MTADQLANLLIDRNRRLCRDRVLSRQLAVDTLFPVLPTSGDLRELGNSSKAVKRALKRRVEDSEHGMTSIALSLLLLLIEVLIQWWLANRKEAAAALKAVRGA